MTSRFPEADHPQEYVCNQTMSPETASYRTTRYTCLTTVGTDREFRWAGSGRCECGPTSCELGDNFCASNEVVCGRRAPLQATEACKGQLQNKCCPNHPGRMCRQAVVLDEVLNDRTQDVFQSRLTCNLEERSANGLFVWRETCGGTQKFFEGGQEPAVTHTVEALKRCLEPSTSGEYCHEYAYEVNKTIPSGALASRRSMRGTCSRNFYGRFCSKRFWKGLSTTWVSSGDVLEPVPRSPSSSSANTAPLTVAGIAGLIALILSCSLMQRQLQNVATVVCSEEQLPTTFGIHLESDTDAGD